MKIFKTLFIALFLSSFLGQSQADKSKILKVSFISYPISTYDTPPKDSQNYATHGETVALAQSYKHHYSLYVDLATNRSIYKMDTLLVENKPAGKENVNFTINSNLDYVVKNTSDSYIKYEKIFQREFYSNGTVGDIEWVITEDKKKINGMMCTKAIPKDEDLLLSVWFTEVIPVSSGPVIYHGLPGLVIWAEDFFWTTEIQGVEYVDDFNFNAEIEKIENSFNTNKKGKNIKEDLLITKKNGLVQSMIDQMN